MSVLIKGMEMPKNCRKCRCSWSDFTRLYCEADGKPWGLEVTEYADGRHPDCPLIEVPPHGRLIDADALIEKFESGKSMVEDFSQVLGSDFKEIYDSLCNDVIRELTNAPIVIPADYKI